MMKVARRCAAFTRSKAGLYRRRHAAEKAAGQAVVIPQDKGERPGETARVHDRDITIPDLSCNESECGGAANENGRAQARP
jgi:hypothetical protein